MDHVRLEDLLNRHVDGDLTGEDRREFERMLLDSPDARRVFWRFARLNSLIRDNIQLQAGRRVAVEHPVGAAVELPQQLDLEPRTPSPEPPFPVLSTTHYPLPATPFVGSWAFSCMVAAVIMGMMLLGFWAITVTHHQHIAEAPSQSVPSDAMPEMVFVGRITGMVDVKWSDDPHYLPPLGYAYVPLGRKYILDSGLMQITYDSGAKVILQGPCTYEVESTASGYLSLGKLTARVGEDKETRRQGDKEKKADAASPHLLVSPSPGLPVSPLFSVRTPTALVTDLGTEFGVEVCEEGCTTSHVFRGSVKVKVVSDEGRGHEVILSENESARVQPDKDAESRLVIVRSTADPAGFVRVGQLASLAEERRLKPLRRWQAFSEELCKRDDLAVYYDFQPYGKGRTVLRNLASTGRKNDGRIENAAWVPGRFPGKYALRFDWPSSRIRVPVNDVTNSRQLTLVAWVRLDSLPNDRAGLLMSDGWWLMGQVHWQILRDGRMSFSVVVGPRVDVTVTSSRPVVDGDHPGQWNLLAVVCDLDAETIVFYRNGDCVGRQALEAAKSAAFKPGMTTAANWYNPHAPLTEKVFALQGCVEELMIFRAALSEEEIRRIYQSVVAGQAGSAIRSEKEVQL